MHEETTEARRILWGAGTPRTMRAHWILHEVGLKYERRPIGSRTGETQTDEFTRINPSQKIPVLQDGEFTLTESAAIVTYIGGTYGAHRGLLPAPDTKARANYYQRCFFLMMELDANALYVIRKHTDLKAIYGEAPNAVLAARKQFVKQAQVVNKTLTARGPFILGESFTGADILLATCLVSAMRRGIELPDAAVKYLERITPREAYKQALVDNQPT
jgi:glutathione S-transferase